MIWGPCLPPPAPPVKDRIKGSYYLCRGNVRYWDGKRLKDKMKDRARHKAYYEANKDKKKAYHEAHKEERKAYIKAYHEAHKEERKAYIKAYHEAHKEERKAYIEANKDNIKAYNEANKPRRNKRRNERKKTDKIYKLKENLGSGLCNALKAQGASKNKRTLEYSCCTLAFLYAHLENQFDDRMTWANWGINGWHIDHRRPKSSFNLQNEEEIYMMQHWTNLQPMWASENIAKGGDYDPETFTREWKGIDIGWQLKNYSFQQLIL
jgi:hypothetical protein